MTHYLSQGVYRGYLEFGDGVFDGSIFDDGSFFV
jgi:hypothetical protein